MLGVLRFLKYWAVPPLALALLGVSARVAAQAREVVRTPVEKVRIEYQAPPECPDIDTFKGLVRSRVSEDWEAAPDEFARRILVEVSRTEEHYLATVELADEAGQRGTKTVAGASCENVVDGIALVTALAIEPRGEDGLQLGGTSPGTDPPPATPATVAPALAPTASSQRAMTEPRPVPSDSPPPPATTTSWKLSGVRLSSRGLVATGVGPAVAGGAAVGIVLEAGGARIGLALQAWRTRQVNVGDVRARFERLGARIEGCPLTFALSRWASIEPCPFLELGIAAGEAFEDPPAVIRGSRGTAPWYAAGGLGRLAGRFGRLVLELEAGVGVPLRRERFYLQGGDEIHRVPAYYGAFAAGLGVSF